MVIRKLDETVKQFYLSGRLDECFVRDAVSRTLGGKCYKSSKKEDIEDHIDFWWESPRKGKIGVDVKGLNKSTRSDSSFDDSIHWLELQNVKGKNLLTASPWRPVSPYSIKFFPERY